MRQGTDTSYHYGNDAANPSHAYLLPAVLQATRKHQVPGRRLIDLGCGNGYVANFLAVNGFEVVGVDPSEKGIGIAREAFPNVEFRQGGAYDDLAAELGVFDVSLSLEVVEHLYSPRAFADSLFAATKPGGVTIVSTPYHGYWKNLSLAVLGKMDSHHNPLREGGHVKFFSLEQLQTLLERAGFEVVDALRLGRVPMLAKSILMVGRRPH